MKSFNSNFGGNLFLAILPDTDASTEIYRKAQIIRRAHGFQTQLTPRDRLHVTLLPLTGLSEVDVEKACGAISETRSTPFEVSFDRTMTFRGRVGSRPFVLAGDDGLRKLKSFRRSLVVAMMERGLTYLRRREFTPHVTLLFGDRPVEEHPVGPIGWTVRDLVLIHSKKGHRHLARWPLHV